MGGLMAIETWGAASAARPRRRPEPVVKELTPFQQDLLTLRLDPARPQLESTRELSRLIGKHWPGHCGDDHRPKGWGWEQVQAYRRVFRRIQRQQQQP